MLVEIPQRMEKTRKIRRPSMIMHFLPKTEQSFAYMVKNPITQVMRSRTKSLSNG